MQPSLIRDSKINLFHTHMFNAGCAEVKHTSGKVVSDMSHAAHSITLLTRAPFFSPYRVGERPGVEVAEGFFIWEGGGCNICGFLDKGPQSATGKVTSFCMFYQYVVCYFNCNKQ